jgi:translation initiation factor IF-3
VAVPRRFDRRPPERDTTRINERIRVPEVRLIDDQGAQVGVLKTPDALRFAQERDLDLVEVAPEARPPVCRVLDYSKYKYEQAQKVKQAKKHQQQITVREIKFRPKIAQHDYDTKKHHVERFLRHKDKVKVTIMFRGREVTHPERGTLILDRLAEELEELGVVEQRPMQEGRNMTMMLGPSKAVLAGRFDASPDGADPAEGAPASESAEADGAVGAATASESSQVERAAGPAPESDGAEAAGAVGDATASESPETASVVGAVTESGGSEAAGARGATPTSESAETDGAREAAPKSPAAGPEQATSEGTAPA